MTGPGKPGKDPRVERHLLAAQLILLWALVIILVSLSFLGMLALINIVFR